MKANDLYATVTEQVLELMEKHGTEWVKPWFDKSSNHNKYSKTLYSGFNTIATACSAMKQGFESNEWATYNQWTKAGYSLKGAKGTAIIFWTMLERTVDGEKEKFPMAKVYHIFNAEQVVDYVPEANVDVSEFAVERIDNIITNSGAKLTHGGDTACYMHAPTDAIRMPKKSSFIGTDTSSPEECYSSVLLHELAHWTGAKSRLDRTKGKSFGDDAYAFEELVAELSAVFSCARLDVSIQPRADSAKYLNNWMATLRDNPKAIQRACSLAQKATDYIMQYDTEVKLTREVA